VARRFRRRDGGGVLARMPNPFTSFSGGLWGSHEPHTEPHTEPHIFETARSRRPRELRAPDRKKSTRKTEQRRFVQERRSESALSPSAGRFCRRGVGFVGFVGFFSKSPQLLVEKFFKVFGGVCRYGR